MCCLPTCKFLRKEDATVKRSERLPLLLWLVMLFVCTLVGMVTGPLGYEDISMGFSAAALVLSAGLILYCLYFWKSSR